MRPNHDVAEAGFRRLLVTALGLLAYIGLPSAANAASFTLGELDALDPSVPAFTIGNLEFFDFDINATTVPDDLITIETVDSEIVPGFVVNGNGEWSVQGLEGVPAPPEVLDFSFQVRTVDEQPLLGGATLWANDYSIENATALQLTLADSGLVDLDVNIFEPFGLPITNLDLPVDSVNLNPRVASLMLDSEMELSVVGDLGLQGPGVLNSYTMLFPVVVPEPGTAALLGLGLSGLHVMGRSRRCRKE